MLKILAIAAHPDDIELGCAGTLIKHVQAGHAVGILDLTEGELGTRGSVATRYQEAADAARVMGVTLRENARMADGFFRNDEEHQRILIAYIRHYRPEIVIANALEDRHPDPGRAGRLIADACFLAGLAKIETYWKGNRQEHWRPRRVYHMMQDRLLEPSFIVDITGYQELKRKAIECYKTQFLTPDSSPDGPVTYISASGFLEQNEARDRIMGKRIGVAFAEAFVSENTPGIQYLTDLVLPEFP